MKTVSENIDKHYLYPSALYAEKRRTMVTTVLGSCVAVCLYDTNKKIGGINHYMLPLWNGNGLATPKYGNIAIEKLIKKMEAMGCERKNFIAKVFGGANQSQGTMNIGGRNADVALHYLEKEGIKVVAKSLGGHIGRKIIFDTETSEVRMKYVKKQKE